MEKSERLPGERQIKFRLIGHGNGSEAASRQDRRHLLRTGHDVAVDDAARLPVDTVHRLAPHRVGDAQNSTRDKHATDAGQGPDRVLKMGKNSIQYRTAERIVREIRNSYVSKDKAHAVRKPFPAGDLQHARRDVNSRHAASTLKGVQQVRDDDSCARAHIQYPHPGSDTRLTHDTLEALPDMRPLRGVPTRRKPVEELSLLANGSPHRSYPESRPSLRRTMMPRRLAGYHHFGATGRRRSSDVNTSTGPEGPTLQTPHFTGDWSAR